MKNSLNFVLLKIFLLTIIFSCSDENDADSIKEVQEEEKRLESIIISSPKQYLVSNTLDKAIIDYVFRDQNGMLFNSIETDSLKNLVQLNINGTLANNIGEVISLSTPTEFNLSANIGNINSNSLIIPSYNVKIELSVNENYLYANGKAKITFDKTFESEQNIIIEENQLTLEYENNILNGYEFITEVPGEYVFKLKNGSIESNEITINALQVENLFEDIKIPLVFHVVPLEGREIGEIGNPTDERIQRGVDMLNSLFSSSLYNQISNPTVINDVSDNQLAAGNISFYLPDNPEFDSPGIIRYANDTPTTSNINDLQTFVQNNSLDTYDYINIFLYPLQGFDFASHYPGTTPEAQIQGLPIVTNDYKPMEYIKLWPNIHYQGAIEFQLGNLLAHEIGHYLGLYHVFKGNENNLPVNSCNQTDSDYVSDTYEYDRREHLENPTTGESKTMRIMCNGQIEEANNVMDYYFANWYPSITSANGGYKSMFTHKQMERMYNVLRTSPVRMQLSGL